jgi:hypothetical protein
VAIDPVTESSATSTPGRSCGIEEPLACDRRILPKGYFSPVVKCFRNSRKRTANPIYYAAR